MPAMMLFYIWNIFANCKEHPELLKPHLEKINARLETCSQGDAYYQLLLLKGVCQRNTKALEEAVECFHEVVRDQNNIKKDNFIAPHAAMELGLTYLDMYKLDESKIWLETARDEYKGFLIEAQVHLRIHGALQKLHSIKKRKDSNVQG